jgi:PAS domain S-box-containing protein
VSENAPPDDENALPAVWRRLAAVVELTRDAILIAGTDSHIVLFNPAAERMFGCCAADAVGRVLQDFFPAVNPQTGRTTDAGQETARTARADAVTVVLARRNDGAEFPAEVVVSFLEQAASIECMVTVRDLSHRVREETTLRNSSSACTQTADGDFVTDKNGIIEYASGAHDREFDEHMWSTLRAGRTYHDVLTDTPTGTTMRDKTMKRVNDVQDGVTDFVVSARDVTQRVQTEAVLRCLNECLERQAKAIAQTLHDEAGQLLTSAYIALGQAKRQLPSSSHEHLQSVKAHLDRIEDQLRRIAHELRPRILDDLGLLPALQFLADGVARRSGLEVSLEGSLNGRLPALVEATIYRVVQEALSNARRHASAGHVRIRLEHEHHVVRCTVADDGIGLDAAAVSERQDVQGMGLDSIRDRIQSLYGTFEIETIPGRGTQLIATIPAAR